MTQSRSLSEKFPSYWQEACTTENVIQCLSIRERKKERLRVEGRIYENKEKIQIRRIAHSKNQGTSSQKGEKSGCINKTKTTISLSSTICIG